MKTIYAYNKKVRLEFDEEKHALLVNSERNYNNVTGITGIIDKSRALIPWAVKLATDYLRSLEKITEADLCEAEQQHKIVKEKAATTGDIVHEFAEHFSLGLKPELPEEEKARNGVLAFLKWLDEEKIKVKNPEEIVYSKKHDYWGIKDSDGTRNKELFAIDYKTSKGIYPEMRLQASAYLFASQEMNKRKYAGYWIVKFGKESGDFEPLYVPLKEAKLDFEAFLGAFEVKKRLKKIDVRRK